MAKDTYKYGNKEYERVPSKHKCFGCDFFDPAMGCLKPNDFYVSCISIRKIWFNRHFQFKEINK